MGFKKDSLLVKIIFYNNLGIIISSIIIAFFVIGWNFTEKEKQIKKYTREKIEFLSLAYDRQVMTKREEVFKTIDDITYLENTKRSEQGKKENYYNYADNIRTKLIKGDMGIYYNSVIAVADKDGKILSESGIETERQRLMLKDNKRFEDVFKTLKIANEGYYMQTIEDKNYIRMYFTNYLYDEKIYIIATIPISYKFMEELKKNIFLGQNDKIFLMTDNHHFVGDFYKESSEQVIDSKTLSLMKIGRYKYYYINKIIEGNDYYIGLHPLKKNNEKASRVLGIAISRSELNKTKGKIIIVVILLLIIFIMIGSNILTKFFTKLLEPLNLVMDAAEEIGNGNYDYNLKFDTGGSGEVKKLTYSFRKMIKEIKITHDQVTEQNQKLNDNIIRIEAIEKLLLGLHIESDMYDAVKTLLGALTSDMGLGYSRAMYFRYNREMDCFLGDASSVNNNLKIDKKNSLDGEFQFQLNELGRLIKSIKIPYEKTNLLGKCMDIKQVIYYNQKGYKFDLGHDIFKGLGINKFMILPVYSKNRDYGCILVDYFAKDKEITPEEYELMNLLTLQISMRIKNKILEEEKIDYEREYTIKKLTERFLNNRDLYLDEMEDAIQKYRKEKIDLTKHFDAIEPIINVLRKENKILKEYSETGSEEFELVDIDAIFVEILNEEKIKAREQGIDISLFVNYHGKIFGAKSTLKKAFLELLKNAYAAVLKTENVDKKINIIVSKDKNVNKIKINITDNGIGLTENHLAQIYEPFLSLDGGSPGLGLSLVYRVVKEHFGVIKFASKYKEGTDVKIVFNAYKEETY